MNHTFTASFLFCGLGAGARGFLEAIARSGAAEGRFRSVGGIDIDPEACKDFEYLTGSPAVCADVSKMTPEALRAAWGEAAPDCVFLSPPCKGFSGLLSKKTASSPKYEALNRLVLQGMFLLCETWPSPPSLLVLENVPRITTRGRHLLAQVRQLLARYGYLFTEATHDCGEIGGLAQHRRRYLLVARLPKKVPVYVYQPPRRRVRACGEVLGELPLPEDPSAGVLHKLPKLSWLNWIRLALIPAGGDWRDLPGMQSVALKKTAKGARAFKGRPGLFGVGDWKKPTGAVTGKMTVSGGNGTAAVADPRLASPLEPGQERRAVWARYDIRPWEEPARVVAGSGSNGGYGVADPRLGLPSSKNKDRHHNKYKIVSWDEATSTVIGATRPGSGALGVADPRPPEWFGGVLGVTSWRDPSSTVTGRAGVTTGAFSIVDPRVDCEPRAGVYGVISWEEAAATITGNARIDNGRFAVADPREAVPSVVPVIIAKDNTWHRPLTTLELAVLQGLPATVNGKPLALAGRAVSRWRERIGNAVPVQAATAIAESLLKALLDAALGFSFQLGGGDIWVQPEEGEAA